MAANLDLTGDTIASSFDQLLHTGHESLIEADAAAHYITNGTGTQSALSISTTRVGIGTEAPATLLHTKTTSTTTNFLTVESNAEWIQLFAQDADSTGIIFYDGGDLQIGQASDTAFSGWDAHLTIKDGGNVGIGVSDPAQKLEVNTVGDSTDCFIKLDADIDNLSGIELGDHGTVWWQIYHHPGSANRLVIVDAGGDDGVQLAQDGAGFTDLSDERLKTSLSPIEDAVDKLNTLQAVNFKWKYGSTKRKTRNNIGLIAQEVNEVIPEAVDAPNSDDFKLIDHPVVDGEKQALNAWGIGYTRIVPVLVKAIQELSAKVTALENA